MHEELHRQLIKAGLKAPGDTERKFRERVAQFARDVTLGRTVVARLDVPVERLVDLIARQASAIADEDIAKARAAGYSDAALFEICVVASVACGMQRLEDAMALLREGT